MKNGLSTLQRCKGLLPSWGLVRVLPMLAVAALLSLPSLVQAQTGVTLPDIGMEPAEYVTAGGTKLGAVLAVAFGIFIVIAIVMAAMYFFTRAKTAR